MMNSFAEIEKLWLEFYELPFPAGMAGEEVSGVCVTSLDTYAAGCVDTFITQKGSLDSEKKSILSRCRNDLEIVVENLDGEAKAYFEKLLVLTNKVLKT